MIRLTRVAEPQIKEYANDRKTCAEKRHDAQQRWLTRYRTSDAFAQNSDPFDAEHLDGYAYQPEKTRLWASSANKCAYCERDYSAHSSSAQIDHYFPKAIFWWLAFVWDNFLPLCGDCNNQKSDHFPILVPTHLPIGEPSLRMKESRQQDGLAGDLSQLQARACLLNPYDHEPSDFFAFYVDESICRAIPKPSRVGAIESVRIIFEEDMPNSSSRSAPIVGRQTRQDLHEMWEKHRQNIIADLRMLRVCLGTLGIHLLPGFSSVVQAALDQLRQYIQPTSPYSAISRAMLQYYWCTEGTTQGIYECRHRFLHTAATTHSILTDLADDHFFDVL